MAKTMNDWTPITEGMPEGGEDVLVTRTYYGKRYVEIACNFGDDWASYSDEYKVDIGTEHKVLAWMPLPEPYKGVQE